jgi:primosomal protein N''
MTNDIKQLENELNLLKQKNAEKERKHKEQEKIKQLKEEMFKEKIKPIKSKFNEFSITMGKLINFETKTTNKKTKDNPFDLNQFKRNGLF